MYVVIALIGAVLGGLVMDLFHSRRGVRREGKHFEIAEKSPYDYALTNARADNERFRNELVTIQATKRIEADTERIRNEIDTILSDGGEEASEGFYDVDKAFMESTDLTFRQYYDVIKTTDDKRHLAGRATLERERQDEDLGVIVEELTALKVEMEEKQRRLFEDEVIPIQEQADGTVSPILPQSSERDTSPMSAITGMSAEEAAWDAGAVARAYAILGTNVREEEKAPASVEYREHRVVSGENLISIARFHGVKVWDIVKDNDLLDAKGHVRVGQLLKIRSNVHEDVSGDELLSEESEERSLINDIKDKASENLELAFEFAKMTVKDDGAIRKQLEETSKELAEETRELRRGIREFREEGKYYGETLY